MDGGLSWDSRQPEARDLFLRSTDIVDWWWLCDLLSNVQRNGTVPPESWVI